MGTQYRLMSNASPKLNQIEISLEFISKKQAVFCISGSFEEAESPTAHWALDIIV